jgi:hypothetical protein
MLKEKMTSRYLTAIRKLLKAYHKKFDCFGKPAKKENKKRKKIRIMRLDRDQVRIAKGLGVPLIPIKKRKKKK